MGIEFKVEGESDPSKYEREKKFDKWWTCRMAALNYIIQDHDHMMYKLPSDHATTYELASTDELEILTHF